MTRRLDGDLVVGRAFGVPDFLTDEAVRWELATRDFVVTSAVEMGAEVDDGPFPDEMKVLKKLSGCVSNGQLDRLHPTLQSDTAAAGLVEAIIPSGSGNSTKRLAQLAVDRVWKYLSGLPDVLDEVSMFVEETMPE